VAKVLVVNDDPATQSMIKLALERGDRGGVLADDGRRRLVELENEENAASLFSMVALCRKGEMEASPKRDRNVASGR